MKIAEFFAVLTLKGGKESVQQMKGLVSASIGAKSALLSATTALYQMSDAARKSAVFMDMYQLNTGLSAIQLQQLSFKASQAGVSMGELGQTIQALQQKSANARLGYGWDPVLTRFGLHPGQDPVTQLNKIGAAIRRLQATNPAEARALASKAGIGDGMYYAMLRGSTEQMNKQLILTEKEQKALVKLNGEWNKFWFYLKQIVVKIQALGAVFQTNVVKILTRAIQGFYELFKRISDVISASDKLKGVALAVGAALAYAFSPMILVLGAVALALEDIFTYFEGGDSVTGRIIEWVSQSKEFLELWESIKVAFDVFIELTKMSYEGWKELIAVLNDAGFFKDILDGIANTLRFIIDGLLALTKIPGVKWLLERAGYGQIYDMADERLNKEMGFLTNASDKILGGLLSQRGSDLLGSGFDKLASMTQNNNVVVQVEGTGDAAKDAQTVATWKNELAQAQGQQAYRSVGGRMSMGRYGN